METTTATVLWNGQKLFQPSEPILCRHVFPPRPAIKRRLIALCERDDTQR